MTDTKINHYVELAEIDTSQFVETREVKNKKTGEKKTLSYLPWAWAVDQLLRKDGDANWKFLKPITYPNGTMMVRVKVTAFGKTMSERLPVLDFKNDPISNPTSAEINAAERRCLTKCISLHGIGINVYQGEDIPLAAQEAVEAFVAEIKATKNREELEALSARLREFADIYPTTTDSLADAWREQEERFNNPTSKPKRRGMAGLKDTLAAAAPKTPSEGD